MPCVIDLGHWRASGCSGHARAAAGAVLCGGARQRVDGHRGLGLAGEAAQGGRRQGPSGGSA
jgi:hypothetical protein